MRSGDKFFNVVRKIIGNSRKKMVYIAHFTFAGQHFRTTPDHKLVTKKFKHRLK